MNIFPSERVLILNQILAFRSLQYVTVGLMSKLDDMQEDFLYEVRTP